MNVLAPPQASVMHVAQPPNLGPRTKQLLATATPKGHFALMADGTLTLIVDGQIRDSAHAVNQDMVRVELDRGMPIVVYGIGAGQLVTAVRTISEQVRNGSAAPILVYEPDIDILATFVRAGLPMQGISIASDMEDFRAMFQHLLQGRSSVSLFHNNFAITDRIHFDAFVDTVRRIVDAEQVTMNTILVRMPEWVRHVSENLEVLPGTKPLMSLSGEFQNVPAFIVGAGPSLDKNGHLLRECAKKGLVFTIDVAGRVFKRFGAEPHIFVAVEGADLSEHLEGVDWIDRVPRAFSLEASPAVLRTGKGPLLPWCDSNHSFADLNANLLCAEGLPIGGSVTTAAFLQAESFGCGPIILVGQDLANTGGKRAAGSVLADKLAVLSAHGTVRKWGEESYTYNPISRCHYWDEWTDTPQWLHARVWFEQRASVVREHNPEAQLFNCTEGGSHVEGFTDMALADVLAQLPDRDIDVMGKLDNVQPIWEDGVHWFRHRQLETLAPIPDLCDAVAAKCHDLAVLITAGDANNPAVQQTLAERQAIEDQFRPLTITQCMFTGSVQPYLKRLGEMRMDAVRKSLQGEDAAAFFREEGELFDAMAKTARELLVAWRGDTRWMGVEGEEAAA